MRRRSLHEGHDIYVRRMYRTCARTIYALFFRLFFLSRPRHIPNPPVVIVRLSESIEGIARLMMSISRA